MRIYYVLYGLFDSDFRSMFWDGPVSQPVVAHGIEGRFRHAFSLAFHFRENEGRAGFSNCVGMPMCTARGMFSTSMPRAATSVYYVCMGYGQVAIAKAKLAIEDVADGMGIARALQKNELGTVAFYTLIATVSELQKSYAAARETRGDRWADEIVEIADTDTDPQRARNRIDARRWCAAKARPDRYGDRIDVTVAQTLSVVDALAEAKRRVQPLIQDAEVIEVQALEMHDIFS